MVGTNACMKGGGVSYMDPGGGQGTCWYGYLYLIF